MKDGGPAFPRTANNYRQGDSHKYHDGNLGMSLRDYFAGQALTGWLATAVNLAAELDSEAEAKKAYEIADAMLKEREK
jgi:hypothetical protein